MTIYILIAVLLAISVFCPALSYARTDDSGSVASVDSSAETSDAEQQDIYEKCDCVLSRYVDKNGDVDYSTLRRKRSDLNDAVREIQSISPITYLSWDDKSQKAFLINAHNIYTLKLVVDNYPIKPVWYLINYPADSPKHIDGGRAREKVFFDMLKHEYTLREIEYDLLLGGFEDETEDEMDILIDRFDDLRVIFALTYASESSAFLRSEAYRPEKLDVQLDDQVRRFLSSDRGMKIDKQENKVYLSGIFNWYKKYFLLSDYSKIRKFREHSDHTRAYLNFVVEFASPEDADYLNNAVFDAKKSLPYYWALNDSSGK